MRHFLRGYVTAAVGESARQDLGARLSDELGAVAQLVAQSGELSVVLTDFGVAVSARRAVVEDLLRDRVHPMTLRVVLRAVQSERADELPSVLHDVFEMVRRLHSFSEDDVRAEEPVGGRSAWRDYASGFAAAVFESLDTGAIENVEDELFRFARIVESNPELRSGLSDPSSPVSARRRLLESLLQGKVQPATLQLCSVVLEGHVRDIVMSLDWLVEQAARARGWRVARVRAAMTVPEAEQRALAGQLERITNEPVELQITEDAELLGGAVVQIGDLLVDASAKHRLDQLEEHLLGSEGTTRGALS